MKIILTQDVPNLGQTGNVKNVATGYARNYLIPNELAMRASSGALKEFERLQAVQALRGERLAVRAEALAERLGTITLTFEAKAGGKGRLYGSITTADIADALEREIGEKLDRRKHILSEPIRRIGRHVVSVRLSPDVVAEVKVLVTPEGGELPEEASGESADELTPVDEDLPEAPSDPAGESPPEDATAGA